MYYISCITYYVLGLRKNSGISSYRILCAGGCWEAPELAPAAVVPVPGRSEAANVFGSKSGNFTGFTPYEGDGYSVLIPAKWNPSKEKDFPGTDLR